MLCNLLGCDNRKEYKIQELNICLKIMFVFIRCDKWRVLREEFRNEMNACF